MSLKLFPSAPSPGRFAKRWLQYVRRSTPMRKFPPHPSRLLEPELLSRERRQPGKTERDFVAANIEDSEFSDLVGMRKGFRQLHEVSLGDRCAAELHGYRLKAKRRAWSWERADVSSQKSEQTLNAERPTPNAEEGYIVPPSPRPRRDK